MHGAAHRIGSSGKVAKADEFLWDSDDRDLAVFEHQVLFGAFENLTCKFQRFLAYRLGCFVDRVTRNHGAAAGKGAGAPIELIGVPSNDVDLGNSDAQLIGGDLGQGGEMPLSLRSYAGRD
jgi:hypothetical protein